MKKIYNQPTVSTVNLLGGSMLMDASPAGISNGGSTDSGIGGGTPIGD